MSDLRKLLDECIKGPWVIRGRKLSKHGGAYDYVSGSGWARLARVAVRVDGTDSDSPTGIANARLIALAPDLAAALLKAEEALDDAIRIAARNEAGPDLDAARATLTEIRKLTGAK